MKDYNEEKIKDIPSLQELRKNSENIKVIKQFWQFIRPILKIGHFDTTKMDKRLKNVDDLVRQSNELSLLPDRFNEIFLECGWISFESMDVDFLKNSIKIFDTEGIEKAEEYLADSFSPVWVERHMNYLKNSDQFFPRFGLAQKALDDYKNGRFYASILVTITLIDGWVNDLNVVDHQRQGFFAAESKLIARDSIAAHPLGLVQLKSVVSRSRLVTRTEEIRIPYRHGIVHGTDLGYDNKYVAAKCWALLFAIRDWAIKIKKDDKKIPNRESAIKKNFFEYLEDFFNSKQYSKEIRSWKPRKVVIGIDVPFKGEISDYSDNSPEQKIIEFLTYWKKKNFGYMANCISPHENMGPKDIRNNFGIYNLESFELSQIDEITPCIVTITIKIETTINKDFQNSHYEFRLIACNPKENLFPTKEKQLEWGISSWRKLYL